MFRWYRRCLLSTVQCRYVQCRDYRRTWMDRIWYLFPWKLEPGRALSLVSSLVFPMALWYFCPCNGTSSVPSELFSALPYILVIILTVCRKQFNVPAKLGANYVKRIKILWACVFCSTCLYDEKVRLLYKIFPSSSRIGF